MGVFDRSFSTKKSVLIVVNDNNMAVVLYDILVCGGSVFYVYILKLKQNQAFKSTFKKTNTSMNI